MEYKQLESSKMASLPIFKHFSEGEVKLNPQEWRKGEFTLFNFLRLAALGGAGYMFWVYVLPILGAMLQVGVVAAGVLFIALAREPIMKMFKTLARNLHKSVIKHDPFGELERQKVLMNDNKTKFHKAKGKISGLELQMKAESSKQEAEADALESTINALNKKSKELLLKKDTIKDRESDEYVDLMNEIDTTISQSERAMYMYNQAKDFTIKYGSRGAIMGKLHTKLKRVANKIDIKIMDFDTTITILKRDFEFAEKSREATETAKSAMLFDKSWEFDYAMDVITSTIARDISLTQSNLSDIDMLTANFSIDDEAMFTKLDKIANDIGSGEGGAVRAKKYNDPEYKLTSEDKAKSGGFGNMEF